MEENETKEAIDLLLRHAVRLQDRVSYLETMVAAMAIMLDLIPEKEDTE